MAFQTHARLVLFSYTTKPSIFVRSFIASNFIMRPADDRHVSNSSCLLRWLSKQLLLVFWTAPLRFQSEKRCCPGTFFDQTDIKMCPN